MLIPVKVSDKYSAEELKELATEKHGKYNQKFCALEDYLLLYPDFKRGFLFAGKLKCVSVR